MCVVVGGGGGWGRGLGKFKLTFSDTKEKLEFAIWKS